MWRGANLLILDRIVETKRDEVALAKKTISVSDLQKIIKQRHKEYDFSAALKKNIGAKNRIIAEVKKASPSKGIIRNVFDHVGIAKKYEENGAVAVSVLTDKKYFMGQTEYLNDIKNEISIPVFRKDFLFDPYQIYESKASGADALLLIAVLLDEKQLVDLIQLASELLLSVLVEVHTEKELEKALKADAQIIGINNRNLQTFNTDLKTTLNMIKHVPDSKTIVSESGISTFEDIIKLKQSGVDTFLIGESLMRAKNPGQKLAEFVGS